MNVRRLLSGSAFAVCLPLLLPSATLRAQETKGPDVDASLKEYVAGFKGRGQLNDDSKPLSPEEAKKALAALA